jgi:hypothetical protein
MTVIGSNFGLAEDSPAVLVGPTNAYVTTWQSHTSIVIRPRGGHGSSPTLQLQVASQSSHLSSRFSYNAAQLSSIAPVELPTTGASIVTLVGFNLGGTDFSEMISKIGATSSEYTRWNSDTTAVVKASSGGGSSLTAAVTFSKFFGPLTTAVTYQKPNIAALTPLFAPTSGFPALSVSGSGFGQSSMTPQARVSSTACNAAVWISDSSVICKVGYGVGRQLGVAVSAGQQVYSLASRLSFQAVEVSSLSPDVLSSSGSTSITIAGSSAGWAKFVLAHRATIGLTDSV